MDIYNLINDGNQPLQLIPLSETRWLARSNSVKRVLSQWHSLKAHFQLVSSSCDKYLSRELCRMYTDHANELYFTFLKSILSEFEMLNLLFQKDNVDFAKLFNELEGLALSMLRRVIIPQYVSLDIDMNFDSI